MEFPKKLLFSIFLVSFWAGVSSGQCPDGVASLGGIMVNPVVVDGVDLGTNSIICPYTEYAITVPVTATGLFFSSTGGNGTVQFSTSLGGTYQPTLCVAAAGGTIYMINNNIATGVAAITFESANGACTAATAAPDISCGHNFTMAQAYDTNIGDQSICDDGSDLVITPTCTSCPPSPVPIFAGGGVVPNTDPVIDDRKFSFRWEEDNSGGIDETSEVNTITSAEYGAFSNPFPITLTTEYNDNGRVCTYTETFNVTVEEQPIVALSYYDPVAASASDNLICIHDSREVTAATSLTPGTVVDYTWEYKLPSATTASYSAMPGMSTITGVETNTYTIDPETGTYTPGSTTPLINPGRHSIRVTATVQGTGCSDDIEEEFVINDRPAVELGWRNGASDQSNLGGTGGYDYADGSTICAGTRIDLKLRDCASNSYGDISTPTIYQKVPTYYNIDRPNRAPTNFGSSQDAYECPCYQDNPGTTINCLGPGDYFGSTVWSITTGASSAFRDETTQTASNSVNVASYSAPETVTYRATVIDANGCTNYDEIELIAAVEPVEFENGGVTYCSGATIGVCGSSPALTIKGSGVGSNAVTPCPGSSSGYYAAPASGENEANSPFSFSTFTWTRTAGTLSPSSQSGTGSNRNLTTGTPTVGSNNYTLQIQDDYGCIGYGDINVSVSDLVLNLNSTNTTVCDGEPLDIINTLDAGYTYSVYKGGNCTISSGCSGGTNIGSTRNVVGSIATITVASGNVESETYWLRASDGSTCITYESLVVTENPALTWTSNATAVFTEVCNDPAIILEAEATGGVGNIVYNWTPTGVGQGNLHTNSGGVMGVESSTGSTGYWEWQFRTINLGFFSISFPVYVYVVVSSTPNNFTYYSNLPTQEFSNPAHQTEMILTATDGNGSGCTIERVWQFDILECGYPVMAKSKVDRFNANTTLNKYVCIGDVIQLETTVPVAPGSSLGYTPTYEWNSDPGLNGSVHSIPVTASSPDSIVSWCTVYNGSEIVGIVFDTTILSRPEINFYPSERGSPDTTICLNEIVNAEVNCPGCRGNIEYVWGPNITPASTGNTYLSGLTVDNYAFTGTVPNTLIDIDLRVRHGEDCEEVLSRDFYVNDLPTVFLTDASGTAIGGTPIYLCDGEVEFLSINTTGCTACNSYSWNTTATTLGINVSAQGGYYAEVVDGNTCTNATDVAIVIDALDGLNSQVVANPIDLCGTGNVDLEVAPCVGCSYIWYESGAPPSVVGSSRVESVTQAGTYYAEVTNSQSCIYQTAPMTISATTVTIPSIVGSTDSLCSGSTSRLSTLSDTGNSYQWYLNGNIISTATDSIYIATTDGRYSVLVTYPNGCSAESPVFEIVPVTYQPNLIVISDIVCNGETADLQTDLFVGWQYQWYNDGVPIPGAIGSIYNAINEGVHYVEVTTNYSCVVRSDSVPIRTSTLSTNQLANTSTPNICPGETAELSASLCTGCFYQWFELSGNPITTSSRGNYGYDFTPTGSNSYYAEISLDGCTENSDTITVTVNSVFTPAISSSSSVICNGRNANLVTPGCTGCSYSWLKNGAPTLGSLNDTFHLVDDINEIGNYQIAVDYPNGCSDTSAILTINDGSYTVVLQTDTTGGAIPDYVICNGVGETLLATPDENRTGTYSHTLFLNNTPVTGYSNVTSGSAFNTFPGDNAGVYTVEVVNPLGCKATSNLLSLTAINIVPTLSSWATSNANSVQSVAICTDSGSVYLEVAVSPTCPNCTYEWLKGGTPIISNSTITSYTTDTGATGTGLYIVNVTDNGCTASSNLVTISNSIGTIDSEANTTDTSICNGQSVTLEHADRLNCVGCSYRWLRGVTNFAPNPINGASNYQYVTSTPGFYNLEVTTGDGCVDTSSVISIRQVDPPSGLTLSFDTLVTLGLNSATGTPLASNGDSIDMNNWVFPTYARHNLLDTTFTSYFTSTPFNGALSANAGLQGTDSIFFQPEDSLAGYHLITYYYDTLGCTFTTSDVLEVNPPAAITVTNLNPVSVAYEACVGDALVINTTNLDFAIDQVFVFDENDDYQIMPLSSTSSSPDTFGVNIRWNTTVNLVVQGNAYASYLMLVGPNLVTGARDTTYTSFVLIHNTDLSFTGLPNMLCSNGEGTPLFGSPTGGSFYAESTTGALIAGAFVGDTLYPQQFNQAAYVDGNQYVDVYYSYRETYTNGQNCPDDDTVSIRKEVKDVRLTNVQFNTISVSQTQELLTNLVSQTTPYAARPNKQPLYTSSFSGSFTNPAGNPTDFLPADAGIGTHALTYLIQSGDCINSVEDSITVVPAPTPIPMPDTICRNYGITSFAREISVFPYGPPTTSYPPNTAVASYTDEFNIISVTGAGVVAGNTNLGAETYTYNPTLVVGNYDTLVIEYGFYRDEDVDSSGVIIDFDSLEYVVAQIIKPIYIEDTIDVNIIDTIVSPFYCQENTLHLLAGSPSNNAFGGGLFMLYGGTNQYQFGDTLHNSVINPYDVNNLENATTTYDLVYVLNGAACNNSDTMSVTIGRGLNPTFATANGLDEFCDTDADVQIIHNVMSPDTAILTIGGVPQPSYLFGPGPLAPGIHVVELQQLYTYIQATDTFVCSASAIDTFTVHALPALTVLPALENQYCANDTIVDIIVGPTPHCPVYTAPGHIILDEKFDVGGVPPNWNSTFNISGKQWVATQFSAQGGTGNAAFIDTSQFLNDSWLITKPLDLVGGHTYRLTYMVRAGELDPTCTGLCDAQLTVGIGNTQTAPMASTLVPLIIVDNDQTYVRYTVEHYHDTLTGFTTGQYFIGFRSVTPALGRSLRLDNVKMRDMTLDNCSLEGIGYMTGPGVHNETDSLYQFNPLAVTAGNVEVKYIYTDVQGCQDSLVFPITVDTAPIVSFTDLPATYCENEPTLLIAGSPLGGAFTSTLGANLVPVGLAVLDTADFPVNYQTNTTGMDIVSYFFEDNNLCSETVHDTIFIVPLLDSMFISNSLDPFGNGHCVNADSTPLSVSPFPVSSGTIINNGTFYGAGVRNGALGANGAIFYPDSAEIDMGHIGDVTIDYIYTTTTGCADTTQFTTRVHALPDLTFMNLPDSLCLNTDSFQVVVINNVVGGSMGQLLYADTLINEGQFTEFDTNGVAFPNFIQLFDTLHPYTADGYSQINVTYDYTASAAFGLCSSTIYDSVRIDSIPEVYFQDLSPYYCENEPASIFLAFPAFSIGSGYLLIDSTQIDSSFYWIDPAVMVGPGMTTAVYPTYYTFTDTRGCQGEVYDTFEVRPYPRITFNPGTQDTFCRQVGLYDLRQMISAPTGGYFTDNLALTSIQDSFYLNLNSLAGPRLVTYHYLDPLTLCQNQDTIWLYLFNSPEIDFTIYGGCAQMDITFDGVANNLEAGIDSITRIWWDFEGNGIITNSHLDTSAITIPDTTYQYGTNGTYSVTMNVQNQGSCPASITKPLIVSPYYDLNADYFEDFNSGAGDWYDDQINVTPSNIWTHENSLTSNFISNSNGFWVTMAAEPYYEVSQSAWVYSPCFDFTTSQRPMIAFDLWRDVLPGIDGAVFEFYNNTSNEWEIVGNVGEGIDWYQSDFVLGRPGNQLNSTFPSGWTGRSNGPESARLRLDQFKGQRDIRFRIAFATSSQTVIDSVSGNGYEGVAFDNVWIGERTRNVLVEHFDHVDYVNDNSLTSSFINQSVYNTIFNSVNGLDVILIQYQAEDQSLGTDPLYSTNPADLSSRQYQYSSEPNNIFVDGRTIGNGLSESLDQSDLDYDMLQFPDFTIDVNTPVTIVNGELTTSATVTALVDKDSSITYTTRVAVIQDSFTYVNNSHMLSVFRKMLPNNGGIRKTDGWQIGEQQSIAQSLTLSTLGQGVPVNESQLEVIVFVQDANDNVRKVYQAATTQDLNRYTGTTKLEDDLATEIFDLNVYPNPSKDLFNVEFDKALEGEYTWRLVDVTGRVLQTGMTATGTKKFTIDAEPLVDGAYFFIINSDDNRAYAQRKLIVIK